MSDARDGFDAIGVVVDWIDACKQRRLDDLLDLYDATATVECCEGGSFRGRSEMERYWRPRLARSARGAFEIDVLMPDEDGVTLDYRWVRRHSGADAFPVHEHGEDQPHRLRAYQSGRLSALAVVPAGCLTLWPRSNRASFFWLHVRCAWTAVYDRLI